MTSDFRSRLEELTGTVERLSQFVGFSDDNPTAEQHMKVRHGAWRGAWRASGTDAAPLEVLRDAAFESDDHAPQDSPPQALTNEREANVLLSIFRTHYRRWIGIKESGEEIWDTNTVRHPLLFTSCCLIATRHSSEPRPHPEATRFFLQAKDQLSVSLLQIRQPLAFFQAGADSFTVVYDCRPEAPEPR